MNSLIWSSAGLYEGIRSCSPRWGKVRLFLFVFIFWVFIWFSNIFFGLENAINIAQNIQEASFVLSNLPLPAVAIPIVLFWPAAGWKFFFFGFGAIWFSLYLGARYVREIHDFDSIQEAFSYLLASLFGIGIPSVAIMDGAGLDENNKGGWIKRVGGPGYINIHPGFSVLLEKLKSPSRVISLGTHYITRFETIKEIVDLRNQQVQVDETVVMTRDRILLRITDVSFHYRIASSPREEQQSQSSPLPLYVYSMDSLKKLVYNRSVTSAGVTTWEQLVKNTILGNITGYIQENESDVIMLPDGKIQIPRDAIAQNIDSAETRKKLREIGTKLIRYDVGNIELSPDYGTLIFHKPWQAEWKGKVLKTRADGEADRFTRLEEARAKSQADILERIAKEWQSLNIPANSKEKIRGIMLERTAQILDTMSANFEADGSNGIKPIPPEVEKPDENE